MKLVTVLSMFAMLVACGDDPYDMRIDTFNIGLAGAFVPNEGARRDPVIDAIAASEADVLCLQEVWEQSDKDRVIAAATAFPFAVSFTHDFDTPIDDPTDIDGNTPCSTIPGDDGGKTTSAACAEEMCFSEVAGLVLGGPAPLQCYSCLTTNLPTETFTDMREFCTTQVGSNVAFRGQSGVMILSKHPISNPSSFVLPGTWNRRIIAEATVTLPNSSEVDIYCNHLTPVLSGLAFPYTGAYGNGMSGANGWGAEELLQAGKLAARVQSRTGTARPAFILGDFNSGVEDMANGLDEEFEETYEFLAGQFTPAVAADFVPSCTFCGSNPNVGGDDAVWIDHIFMANVDASAVVSTEVTYQEAVVDAEDTMVPLSDHYGLSAVVTIP